MTDLKITGTVQELLQPQSGEGKSGTWTKQEFILQTDDDKYPESICIEIWGDKVETPEVDDKVTVSFNIESREYNGRWYTNVRAWKIESEQSDKSSKSEIKSTPPLNSNGDPDDPDSTLPF
jgi:hypothetical protein